MSISNSSFIRIFSNYFGKIWNFFSIFLLTPLYIYYLGMESYAVIAFYILVISIITLADAGVASAVTREFSLDKSNDYKYKILKKIEKIYWFVFFLIAILMALSSNVIVELWLKTEKIDFEYLSNCVVLIAIGSCIQLISSIYYGGLFGVGKQVGANIIQIIWTTSKSLTVIPLFIFFEASLYVFFVWQILCNILYVFFLRYFIFKEIAPICNVEGKIKIPKEMIKYIGGMFLISFFSALTMQADKIVVGYFFSLKDFGQYWIASYLSQICIFIGVPMASFVFPLLSKYHNNKIEFNKIFINYTNLLHYLVIPFSFFLFLYSEEILKLWMHKTNADISTTELYFLVKSLCVGSLLFTMQMPFYYSMLAKFKTKYIVYQSIMQMFISVTLLIYFAKYGDLLTLGIPWIIVNFLSLSYLMYITFSNYIKINITRYFMLCFAVPFFVCGAVGVIGRVLYEISDLNFLFFSIPALIISFLLILNLLNSKEKNTYLKLKKLFNFPKG